MFPSSPHYGFRPPSERRRSERGSRSSKQQKQKEEGKSKSDGMQKYIIGDADGDGRGLHPPLLQQHLEQRQAFSSPLERGDAHTPPRRDAASPGDALYHRSSPADTPPRSSRKSRKHKSRSYSKEQKHHHHQQPAQGYRTPSPETQGFSSYLKYRHSSYPSMESNGDHKSDADVNHLLSSERSLKNKTPSSRIAEIMSSESGRNHLQYPTEANDIGRARRTSKKSKRRKDGNDDGRANHHSKLITLPSLDASGDIGNISQNISNDSTLSTVLPSQDEMMEISGTPSGVIQHQQQHHDTAASPVICDQSSKRRTSGRAPDSVNSLMDEVAGIKKELARVSREGEEFLVKNPLPSQFSPSPSQLLSSVSVMERQVQSHIQSPSSQYQGSMTLDNYVLVSKDEGVEESQHELMNTYQQQQNTAGSSIHSKITAIESMANRMSNLGKVTECDAEAPGPQAHSSSRVPSTKSKAKNVTHPREESREGQVAPRHELQQTNDTLASELQHMKKKLTKQESQMDSKVSQLEQELRKQEQELHDMSRHDRKLKAKEEAQVSRLSVDLEAYKSECISYRERILQKERENSNVEELLHKERMRNAKIEELLLEERRKVQMLLSTAEESPDKNSLRAYKDQCDNYRDRVIGLEREALTVMGTLEASEQTTNLLKEERKSLDERLSQLEACNSSLEAQNEALQKKAGIMESELSTLRSVNANMKKLKEKSEEDKTVMDVLEAENAKLRQKLGVLANVQAIVDRCSQLEDQNVMYKKRNDELMAKHFEMSSEVDDAKNLLSNTERLHKMMSENEQYISKLQDDLATARSTHLESLQKSRAKYTEEVTLLAEKLRAETKVIHDLEVKNVDLEDKVTALERNCKELETSCAQESKTHSDQMLRLMEHADESKQRSVESHQANEMLKQELIDVSRSHYIVVQELQEKINSLGEENCELTRRLNDKEGEVERLERTLGEKEEVLGNAEGVAAKSVEGLNATIQLLEEDLKGVTSSRDLFQRQLQTAREQLSNAMKSIEAEKAALLSDVQSYAHKERDEMVKQVKAMVIGYSKNADKYRLQQSMSCSVAMAEKHEVERLLNLEKENALSLKSSLDKAEADNRHLKGVLHGACRKLSAEECPDTLIDAIGDVLIDRSDARIKVRTLEVDLAAFKTSSANLEVENDSLKGQIEGMQSQVQVLESKLEEERHALRHQLEGYSVLEQKLEHLTQEAQSAQDQMQASFDNDRRTHQVAMNKMLSNKQALMDEVDALTAEIRGRDEEMVALRNAANEERRSCEDATSQCKDIASKYEECRGQLAALLDKTVTSKNKTDDLMNHYMNIEKGLRDELQLAQSENEKAEREIAHLKSDLDCAHDEYHNEKARLESTLASKEKTLLELSAQVEGFQDKLKAMSSEKINLTSRLGAKEQSIQELESRVAELDKVNAQRQTELNILEEDKNDLQTRYEQASSERDFLTRKQENLASAIAELESSKGEKLKELSSMMDSERMYHTTTLDAMKNDIVTITVERDTLSRKVESLESSLNALQTTHISKDATHKKLKEDSKGIEMENDSLAQQAHELSSALASLRLSYDKKEATINQLRLMLEEERIHNGKSERNESDDLMMEKDEKIEFLSQEANLLGEEIMKLIAVKSRQESHIIMLKDALKGAVDEACRLGSTDVAAQSQLLCMMSSSEEENMQCNLPLKATILDEDDVSEVSTQNTDNNFDLKSSLERIIDEKQRIECKLHSTERKLYETMKAVTHYELKLTKAEQQRDEQYANVARLQSDLKDLEETQQDHSEAVVTTSSDSTESMREDIHRLTIENANIINDNKLLTKETNRLTMVNDYILRENSSLAETVANLDLKLASKDCDEASSASGSSRASHIKQTASELQTTIRTIKKHHSNSIAKLQGELDDSHKRLKKYERKIGHLTKLLEENAHVIESLHQQLKSKENDHFDETPQQSCSDSLESAVTE